MLAYLFCTSTSSNVRLFHIMTKASPYKNTSISETLQESELVRPGFSHTGLFLSLILDAVLIMNNWEQIFKKKH